jgi:hypothetical protein
MTMRLAITTPTIATVLVSLAGCASAAMNPNMGSTPTIAEAFASSPPYPGRPWTHRGQPVPASEIAAAAGPEHCGWQSVTFLSVGWPLGTRPATAAGARQFIRDPRHVLPRSLQFKTNAMLPSDAHPTGYFYGVVELYLSPTDQGRAVYLVSDGSIERWPRSDPMLVCQ